VAALIAWRNEQWWPDLPPPRIIAAPEGSNSCRFRGQYDRNCADPFLSSSRHGRGRTRTNSERAPVPGSSTNPTSFPPRPLRGDLPGLNYYPTGNAVLFQGLAPAITTCVTILPPHGSCPRLCSGLGDRRVISTRSASAHYGLILKLDTTAPAGLRPTGRRDPITPIDSAIGSLRY
jgi:hypothetical protein